MGWRICMSANKVKLNQYTFHTSQREKTYLEINEPLTQTFDEMIISWNSRRPLRGSIEISASIKQEEGWSSKYRYASWGTNWQGSFNLFDPNNQIFVNQDIIELKGNQKGQGYRIFIEAKDGADLSSFHDLYVCTTDLNSFKPLLKTTASYPLCLNLKGLSQIAITDPRNKRICSPTSTTAVLRFLQKDKKFDPLNFAEKVWDQGFDIFGNWVFNVAQAYEELDGSWKCWVERLTGFDRIYASLRQGIPVITSVRGPLPGSASEYSQGHLMTVIGYNPESEKVVCMDPAFPEDQLTLVSYHLDDFLKAWERRKNIAYLFEKKESEVKVLGV